MFVVPAAGAPKCRRVLIAVDFSEHSREALAEACALVRATPGASLTALHVYDVPLGWHKSGRTYEEFAALLRGHAEEHWDAFRASVPMEDVSWTVRFDLGAKIPKTTLAAADEIDADLIVVGSHGRTRAAGMLLGHVADTVCARTSRPVLCVKRKGEVVTLLHALLQVYELEKE